MSADWIDILLQGQFGLPLPKLTILQGNSISLEGSGRILWSADTGVRLQATTEAADSVLDLLNQEFSPGRLLREDQYLNVWGETGDGRQVSMRPQIPRGFHYQPGSSSIPWDLEVSDLNIEDRGQDADRFEPGRKIRALLGPPLDDWPRITRSITENPYFGHGGMQHDWLTLEQFGWDFAARQRDPDWFELRWVLPDRTSPGPVVEELRQVMSAFGFLTGRNLYVRGYEEVHAGGTNQFIAGRDRKPTRKRLSVPLSKPWLYWHYTERLLSNLLAYFSTPQGDVAAEHLWVYRDATDTSLRTRQVVTSVCLEGLLRIAAQGQMKPEPGYTPNDVDHLNDWLRDNEAIFSRRFVRRVRGFLGSLRNRRPEDVLWLWKHTGVLGVTEEDVTAWKETRPASVHAATMGSLGDDEEFQECISNLFRLENLVNRVVLQLVGYEGKYTDYAAEEWPEKDFPPS